MRAAFVVQSTTTHSIRALNYNPLNERFRRPSRGRTSFLLGDQLSSLGRAYGSVFTRIDCDPLHGVELLSQTDSFASEPTGRVVRIDSMSRPERHEIKQGQVLIAGAGTLGETELFGRSIIADARLAGKYICQHSLVLEFAAPGSENHLYSYAFLCTSAGVSLLRSTSYGTKILGLRKEAVAGLCIPDVDTALKKQISAHISTAMSGRGEYLEEIRAARQIIEDLPEVRVALAECDDRKPRCIVSTGPFLSIGARNHAALGSARHELNRRWKTRLETLLEPKGIYNGPRFARVNCLKPHGIDFLDQRDIFAIRPVARRIVEPAISKRQLYVPPHALVVASHGQISEGSLFGRVESASFGLHKCGITQDILRVLPKPEHHDFLLAYLSSRIGFYLLKSTAIGTSIPMMHTGLLSDLPCPSLSQSQLTQLSLHVQAAMKARSSSEAAEAEAVRIIEQEVLPSWLA